MDSWIEYWDAQSDMGDGAWRKNAELFLEGSASLFPFGPEDRVLDIGSGPGFLAESIRGRVRAVHCVDTSRRYIEQGRQRLADAPNVTFSLLGEDYLDFSFLGSERFSRIVCASVIQYFKSVDEVERLIAEVRGHALPGALLLIADVPVQQHILRDLAGLLRTAWRRDYLWKVLRFTARSLRGDYARLRKTRGLLALRPEQLEACAARLGLRGEWSAAPLTLNDARRHFLIRF